MAHISYLYNCRSLAVLAGWDSSNLSSNSFRVDPDVRLILAVGVPQYAMYRNNYPVLDKWGFSTNNLNYENPNTGRYLSFHSKLLDPEQKDRVFQVSEGTLNRIKNLTKQQTNNDLGLNTLTQGFPMCCGLLQAVRPNKSQLPSKNRTKLGEISPCHSDEEVALHLNNGYSEVARFEYPDGVVETIMWRYHTEPVTKE